jgi:hypothetical protein
MSERQVDVFFYGLFMDEDVLREKDIVAATAEIAWVDGRALRIGKRAALVPAPGARAYGVVMSMRQGDLQRLYSEAGLEAYRPKAILVHPAGGGVIAALCYNLPQAPAAGEHNSEYAARLRTVAHKVGLPAEYIDSLQ